MTNGIVYSISHPAWMEACIVSAHSAAATMPEIERELYLTEAVAAEFTGNWKAAFVRVVVLDTARHFHRPRFEAMLQTRLDRALFIDADTFFIEPVHELFELLDHFDVAALPAPQYIHPQAFKQGILQLLPEVSEAVPEWNGGVIAARMNTEVRQWVENWSALFEQCMAQGYQMDQASLRSSLVHSGLRIASLPNNYNFRANIPQVVARKVKILHAHGDLPTIARTINDTAGIRAYTPDRRLIHGQFPKDFTPQSMEFFRKQIQS
jgi:hypothetical protein